MRAVFSIGSFVVAFAMLSPSFSRAQDVAPSEAPPPPPLVIEAPEAPPADVTVVPDAPADAPPPPLLELAPVPPPPAVEVSPSLPPGYGVPDAPGMLVLEEPTLTWTTEDDAELRRRERIARIGGGLLPVVGLIGFSALAVWAGNHEDCIDRMSYSGDCRDALYIVGGMSLATHGMGTMMAVGALRAAKYANERGIPVRRGLAFAALALSLAPYGNAISWIFAWAQIAKVNRALRRLHPTAESVAPVAPPTGWD